MAPPQGPPHTGFNFVQPSPIQEYQNFEQLNMANPPHQSNNTKKKGKDPNNNNPGLGGNQNQPEQNQSTGGNPNQGNQNPEGGNNKKRQGRNNNNVRTTLPCALYSEFGHYTHHFPQITEFKLMKDFVNGPHPSTPHAPQQAPQQYVHPPPQFY
jgi:hypothetical protein